MSTDCASGPFRILGMCLFAGQLTLDGSQTLLNSLNPLAVEIMNLCVFFLILIKELI